MNLNYKKRLFLLLLGGMLSAQAQITNTGELGIAPNTVVTATTDLTNSALGTFSNDGSLYLQQNLINQGGFTFNNANGLEGILYLNGSSVQHISGTGMLEVLRLQLQNANGIELAAALSVVKSADFSSGSLNNRDFGGELWFEAQAVVQNTANNSHVNGLVHKTGNTNFVFPVGATGQYRSLAISAITDANAVFKAQYMPVNSNSLYPHTQKQVAIELIDTAEYWQLEKIQGAGSAKISLSWSANSTPATILADTSTLHIVRWNASQNLWVDEGGVVTGSSQTVVSENALSSFGVFTLATVTAQEDTDGDGVPDLVEENDMPPTDPNDPTDFTDSDGDGVPDYVEENGDPATDPNNPDDFTDTDGDGVPDYVEEHSDPATDPNNPDDFTDTDGDGVPDYVEEHGDPATDPNNPDDFTDTDGDGVPDYVEEHGYPATDPNNPDDFTDTDGDGVPDYVEEHSNPATDPNNPDDFTDTDGDGVPDYIEEHGDPATDPNNPDDFTDTDGDGVPDYVEVNGDPTSNPNNPNDFADADGDGISDYKEKRYDKDSITIENDLVSKSVTAGFFEIVNIERFPDNTVEIFNRNGIKVFSIQGYNNNDNVFRGVANVSNTLNTDKGLATGIYFYVIKYSYKEKSKTKSGYLYINE